MVSELFISIQAVILGGQFHLLLSGVKSLHLSEVKDVLMGIAKSDLLDITVAVIHVSGQRFLAV